MEQEMIEKIAELMITKLIERARKLLLVYTGSPLGLEEIHPQLKRLREEGYEFSLYASCSAAKLMDVGEICRSLDAADCSGEGYKDFLKRGSAILVPALTQNTAAKLALGMSDSEVLNILSRGLMRGYEIVACTEGCCPDSPSRRKAGLDRIPSAYRQRLIGNLQALESYGVRLARPDGFYDAVKLAARLRMTKAGGGASFETALSAGEAGLSEEKQPAVQEGFAQTEKEPGKTPFIVRSKVVTLSDVITIKRDGALMMDGDAILTPSAREHIRDLKIEMVRRS